MRYAAPMARDLPLVGALILAMACGGSAPDPAFATPRATLMTLLRTHHLDKLPQQEIRKRMGRRDEGGLGPIDKQLMARCFEDFETNDPLDHGLAGFVIGAVAAKRDDLRVRIQGDTAAVEVGGGAGIVLHRRGSEGWKISLRDSVPRAYRERMEGLYEAAKRQTKHHTE